MLSALRDAIEQLEIPPTAAGLVKAFELFGRLHAHLAEATQRFAASGDWALDGAQSPRAWLFAHARLDKTAASRILRHGTRLDSLPVTMGAAKSGELSADQAVAITSNVSDKTIGLFASQEAELVPTFTGMTVSDTAKAMQYWKTNAEAVTDPDDPTPDDSDERRSLYLSQHFGGNWRISGDLAPEAGRVIDQALTAATVDDAPDVERTLAERRADALESIARFYLDHHGKGVPVVNRPGVVIIATLDQLTGHDPTAGVTLTGQPLTRAQLNRITCDSTVHRMLTAANGAILDFGHHTRTISSTLRLAVATRDRHCRFPNCDRPPDECEVHHVIHWAHGGETALWNLLLGCNSHHPVFHHPDWTVKHGPGDEIHFTTPTGQTFITRPPPHKPLALPLPLNPVPPRADDQR
jgi:Domain of unknown function (DUF222)